MNPTPNEKTLEQQAAEYAKLTVSCNDEYIEAAFLAGASASSNARAARYEKALEIIKQCKIDYEIMQDMETDFCGVNVRTIDRIEEFLTEALAYDSEKGKE